MPSEICDFAKLKPMGFFLNIISWKATFVAYEQCWHSSFAPTNSRSTFFRKKLYQTIAPRYNGVTVDTRVGIVASTSDQGNFSQPAFQTKKDKRRTNNTPSHTEILTWLLACTGGVSAYLYTWPA